MFFFFFGFVEKDTNKIKQLVQERSAQILSQGDDCLYVAISRKGAQLMRYVQSVWNNIIEEGNLFQEELAKVANTSYITEIALPFIKPDGKTKAVIIDDAIYHGTTYEKVEQLAYTALSREKNQEPVEIVPAPIVVSKSARKIDEDRFENLTRIEEETIPFYINTVMDIVHFDNHPYDVEFPIFHFPLSSNASASANFINRLIKKIPRIARGIQEQFGGEVQWYEVKRKNHAFDKEDTSYSIILDNIFPDDFFTLKPEMAKLRLYITEKEVLITSYCLTTLDREWLTKDSVLFNEEINAKVWNPIVEATDYDAEDLQRIKPFESVFKTTTSAEDLIKSWEEQRLKSLAIMANYILSYYLMRHVSPIISEVLGLENNTGEIQAEDLKLILGPELPDKVINGLKEIEINLFGEYFPAVTEPSDKLIPWRYNTPFEFEYLRDSRSNPNITVENSFTAEFGAMHRKVELRSRYDGLDNKRRLYMGESFPALMKRNSRLGAGYKPKEVRKEVHRALDRRIDHGSVVPNYVPVEMEKSHVQWSRLFRSGENDDPMRDQMLRNLLFVIYILGENQPGGILSANLLNFALLVLELNGIAIDPNRNISYDYQADQYAAVRHDENGRCLIDIADRAKAIEMKSASTLMPAQSDIESDLSKGNLFSDADEKKVRQILQSVSQLYSVSEGKNTILRESLNFRYGKAQLNDLEAKLSLWIERFKRAILVPGFLSTDSKDNEKDVVVYDLDRNYFSVYKRIPDKNEIKEIFDLPKAAQTLLLGDIDLLKLESLYAPLYQRVRIAYYALILIEIRLGYLHGSQLPEAMKVPAMHINDNNINWTVNGKRETLLDLIDRADCIPYVLSLSEEQIREIIDLLLNKAK